MKLKFGPIPIDEMFFPEENGWNKCREPKAWVVIWFISVPIAVLLFLIFAVWIKMATDIKFLGISVPGFILIYFILIIIHELIHAILQPDRGVSDKTVLGFWLANMVFYAHYEGERTKENFLLGSLGPFVALSVAPALVASYVNIDVWWYGTVIILNSLFCSIDVFSFLTVYFMIPSGSILRNKGWYTYWRDNT